MNKFLYIICAAAVLVLNTAQAQNTCASAIPITQASLPYASGALTTCGTVDNYGVGAGSCNTLYGGGEDYVFSLAITSAPVTLNFSLGGTGTYKICQIFTGCPSPAGAPTNCLGNMVTSSGTSVSGNFTFPSTGTYYIVIDTWPSPACGAFTLGISPPPSCPGGLGGVTSVASLPFSNGAGTTCGAGNEITSTNVSNICGSSSYYGGEDYVWAFTPATSGNIVMNLTSGGSYTGLMLYQGCPFSGGTCVASGQGSTGNKGISACVVAGQQYYLILDSWPSPTCNPFTNLTISAPTAVSAASNDWCYAPIPLSAGGTFSGSTNGMTADQPGNFSSVFCGSTENNQWFTFVATAATATFGFNGIGGASCPYGVQGQVFSVATTPTPCASCTSFTNQTSPCYNPGTLASGTLTATGLTVGQTYYLVVDGNAGSQCTFNIAGWTNPVLPVEMVYFKGEGINSKTNKLEWLVAQEKGLSHYIVQRSFDAKTFTDLDYVIADGSINREKTYNYNDRSFDESLNYYRLKIIDKDGSFKYSNIVAINSNKSDKFKVNKIFPNPASSELYMSVDVPTDAEIQYMVMDITGRIVTEKKEPIRIGTSLLNVNIEKLSKGIYYLQFVCGDETKVEKFSVE